MARLGIVGHTNVGKTTLFNALTGLDGATAPHPYTTTEPNVGVAEVPDPGLAEAAGLEGSKKLVHATLELLDLPATARPDKGGGLGARFLGRLREVDALIVVLRAFSDEAVLSEDAGDDPAAQAEELMLELTIADAEVFARRAEKAAKEATSDPSLRNAAAAIARAATLLQAGEALRTHPWTAEERAAFRDLAPLTMKPVVWVVNAGEDDADADDLVAAVTGVVPPADPVVVLSARLEAEAAQLDPADRADLFQGLGLGEGALARIVTAAYDAIGLVSFYTLGPREAHAWTVRRGAGAREAAGKIHSDLERGFIRAEIATLDDVLTARGWDAAKAAGKVRLEGADYPIAPRDVMLVRFSV